MRKKVCVMRLHSSIEDLDIWTIAGTRAKTFTACSQLGYTWLSLFTLSGRDCRRLLQIRGIIIANEITYIGIKANQR